MRPISRLGMQRPGRSAIDGRPGQRRQGGKATGGARASRGTGAASPPPRAASTFLLLPTQSHPPELQPSSIAATVLYNPALQREAFTIAIPRTPHASGQSLAFQKQWQTSG